MMTSTRAVLNQLNIVSEDFDRSIAFYRRLGMEIPESNIWRTASGAHHANAAKEAGQDRLAFDIDSVAFAQIWNSGWKGRSDLKGRVVVGFGVPSREAVDALYADLTGAGHKGLQAPYDAFWGARYAMVEDPDGIAVGLMSPISADDKSAPPEV
jgi:catechol 2,3-dioxygenase-like lactoylglutathione lyase family enzyme